MDPALTVSVMQLLAALYQIRVAQKQSPAITYEVVNTLANEFSISPDTPIAVFAERLKSELPDSEAKLVLADLNTLSLMSQSPDVASFDYWSMLTTLFSEARDLCHRNHIFRLRGFGAKTGERILTLPETAAALFDAETKRNWVGVRYEKQYEPRGTAKATLCLIEGDFRLALPYGVTGDLSLPLFGDVTAKYIHYNSGGYGGPPPIEEVGLGLLILPGDDIHWLRFVGKRFRSMPDWLSTDVDGSRCPQNHQRAQG